MVVTDFTSTPTELESFRFDYECDYVYMIATAKYDVEIYEIYIYDVEI